MESMGLWITDGKNDSKDILCYLPAIYIDYLMKNKNSTDSDEFLFGVLNLASYAFGQGLLIKGGSAIIKIAGALQMANSVANLTLQSETVRNKLQQSEDGRKFLELWPTISVTVDVATLSSFVIVARKAIIEIGRDISLVEQRAIQFQIERAEAIVAKGGSKTLYSVDKSFQAKDEIAGVFKKGEYRPNPTATTIDELTINPSGTVKGKKWLQKEQTTEELLNGSEYMYVIDENDRLIIGTRAQHTTPPFSTPSGKAPHPTLISGADPKVQAAGTVEFRGGKIYKVDNASGHYKPSAESLKKAEEIFKRDFPANSFTNDFKGFIEYGN
jgi:hypothetical protein